MRATSAVLMVIVVVGLSSSCDRQAPRMTAEEIAEVTEGQPEIFVQTEKGLTLEGIEDFYLGQEKEEARSLLEEICDVVEVYDGGWRHKNAVFKGCVIDEDARVWSLRVGFWPHNDDRVSTLEIKDRVLSPQVVRARFTEMSGALVQDLPRRGLVMMANSDHKLFASWDDGLDQPAHLIVGFHP